MRGNPVRAADRASTFDELYRDGADPWGVRDSAYERRKYAATLLALPRLQYANLLELGCGIGVLTAQLLCRANRVIGVDVSAEALHQARSRLGPAVSLRHGELPAAWPAGRYDAIVFSEVLYFLSAEEIDRCAAHAVRDILPGGHCLLVNWTGPNDLPLNGDAAAARFIARVTENGWHVLRQLREEKFRIDLLGPAGSGE